MSKWQNIYYLCPPQSEFSLPHYFSSSVDSQYIQIKLFTSQPSTVTIGVPQGSVLGTLSLRYLPLATLQYFPLFWRWFSLLCRWHPTEFLLAGNKSTLSDGNSFSLTNDSSTVPPPLRLRISASFSTVRCLSIQCAHTHHLFHWLL